MNRTVLLLSVLLSFGSIIAVAQDAADIKPDYDYVDKSLSEKYNTSAAAQFFDNPAAFKDKTVRLIARLAAGGQLRATVGFNVRFIAYTKAPIEYFFITIPKDMEVPNVSEFGDTVIITFRCEQGLLDKGNIALSIVRAKR
jgi:hypothetical protein